MIFKIRKNLFALPEDYVVKTSIGEPLCKIAKIRQGYYIYNKVGAQIAQVVFSKHGAKLSVASSRPAFPGAINLVCYGKNRFEFEPYKLEKDDQQYVDQLKGKHTPAYSIWGDTVAYNFDIYYGKDIAANIVPCLDDPDRYQIRMHDQGNLLVVLMILLATEYFNAK